MPRRDWTPARVHIINGDIPGVGGYVSGSDAYPPTVAPYSNAINAIYLNTEAIELESVGYLVTLAHELQHVIHGQVDESESGWLNEGLSELAVTEAGFEAHSWHGYARHPATSVVNWPADLGGDNVGLNYGAASLFAHIPAGALCLGRRFGRPGGRAGGWDRRRGCVPASPGGHHLGRSAGHLRQRVRRLDGCQPA